MFVYCRVVVQGPGPGPRYGHVMALVGQRYLMAIGGNDGQSLPAYCRDIMSIFGFSCTYVTHTLFL